MPQAECQWIREKGFVLLVGFYLTSRRMFGVQRIAVSQRGRKPQCCLSRMCPNIGLWDSLSTWTRSNSEVLVLVTLPLSMPSSLRSTCLSWTEKVMQWSKVSQVGLALTKLHLMSFHFDSSAGFWFDFLRAWKATLAGSQCRKADLGSCRLATLWTYRSSPGGKWGCFRLVACCW